MTQHRIENQAHEIAERVEMFLSGLLTGPEVIRKVDEIADEYLAAIVESNSVSCE